MCDRVRRIQLWNLKRVLLTAVLLTVAERSRAHEFSEWLPAPVDGFWQNALNWSEGVPDQITEAAEFSASAITAVTLQAPIAVQGVVFEFAPSYTFAGSTLSVDIHEAPTAISVLAPGAGSIHVFQNPVLLFSSEDPWPQAFFQLGAGSSLAFTGGLTSTDMGLALLGFDATAPATVFVNGPVAANIGGLLTANPAADLGGAGTINATSVEIAGGISPGASADGSPAALTINGALTLSNRSLTRFDLGGLTTESCDRIIGLSTLAVSGTLYLRAVGGFATASLEAGATFHLLDWSGPPATDSGFGFALDSTLAPLPSGVWWDMSNLLTDGTVYVAPALPNLANGGTASASAGGAAADAFDGNSATSWTNGPSGGGSAWVQYRFGGGVKKMVNRYTLISSTDTAPRDPRDWEFQASNDGVNWSTLGVTGNRLGIVFANRGGMKIGAVVNETAYEFYRLNMTQNNGGAGLSLAELGLHYAPPAQLAVTADQLRGPEIVRSGNTISLRVSSARGPTYQLQRTGDLALGTWENRGAIKTGTGSLLVFTDSIAGTEPRQFYRLAIEL